MMTFHRASTLQQLGDMPWTVTRIIDTLVANGKAEQLLWNINNSPDNKHVIITDNGHRKLVITFSRENFTIQATRRTTTKIRLNATHTEEQTQTFSVFLLNKIDDAL